MSPGKQILTGIALFASILTAAPELRAADYTVNLPGNANWDTAPWAQVPSGGGVPGAGDRILDIGSSTTRNFYLNGDREITSLGRTSTGNIRILNGSSSGVGANNTLTITEGIYLQDSGYLLRSQEGAARFTITAPEMILGSPTAGTTGRLTFGDNANYRNITFRISGTTTLTGINPAVVLGTDLTREDTIIDLGHVIFEAVTGGSPGLSLGSGALTVASLRSVGSGGTAGIRGSGTLLIDGDAGDVKQPAGDNVFGAVIQNTVTVEKTGSNLQIFSSNGNIYTGGTIISGGILSLRNTDGSGVGRGMVEVRNGGRLAGDGIIEVRGAGVVTVKEGGLIAPGAGGDGFSSLKFSGIFKDGQKLLVMESGAGFAFNLNETGQSDMIQFGSYTAGDLVLGPGSITINIDGTLSDSVTYTLFTFKTGNAVSGTATSSGLTGGLSMGTGFEGFTAQFHYDEAGFGGVGTISMTVAAIPEPRLGMLSTCLGAAFFLRTMKRRRSAAAQVG